MIGLGLTRSLWRSLPALALGGLMIGAAAIVPVQAQDSQPAAEPAAAEPLPEQSQAVSDGAQAGAAPALSAAQEDAVRALVRETIMNNPEILIEALQLYDQQQKQAAEDKRRENLVSMQDELANDPLSPVLGNPAGDVVIVEFFDYRCPYCKKVAQDVRTAVREDGNVKLVLKEFPILGPDSIVGARAALAAEQQGRYEDFHFALMEVSGELNETTIMAVAEGLGLDMHKLQVDMESSDIDTAIRRNYSLAEALDIGGTPAFVIGTQVFPGAISMEDIREAITNARAS